MNEMMSLLAALASGVLIGALFFGGLLWTVRQGMVSAQPAAWFLVSLLARMSLALTAFYFVGRGRWQCWLLCLVGFTLARFMVQRLQTWQAFYAS